MQNRFIAALIALLVTCVVTVDGWAASNRSVVTSGNLTTVVTDLNEELDQLFDVSSHPLDTVAGTNTITASVADMPALTAYVNGQIFTLEPANTNTGAVTLNLDSVGAKSVVNAAGSALSAGELIAGTVYLVEYLGGADDHFRLLTAAGGSPGAVDVNIQTFTASGTYTPTAGLEHVVVVCTGAGGGGGGADTAGGASDVGVGGGGGAGGTAIEEYSAATIGASQTVTIGAGGAAGSTTGGNGGTGGDTTFGALMTATGGSGGTGSGTSGANSSDTAGGAGGTPTGGDINIPGGDGGDSFAIGTGTDSLGQGGAGGASHWGGGGMTQAEAQSSDTTDTTAAGDAGSAYGSGGSGAVNLTSTSGVTGGAGKDGLCVVYEYI